MFLLSRNIPFSWADTETVLVWLVYGLTMAYLWLIYGLSMAYLWLIAEGMPMDKLFKDIFEEGFLAAW
jgi:hypothetical protein